MVLRISFLLTFFLFYSETGAFAAHYFRCGSDLVSVGDTKEEVIEKCGEPTSREVIGEITDGYYRGTGTGESIDLMRRGNRKVPIDTDAGTYSEISRKIEAWDYNCGANSFSMTLIFVGHELRQIEQQGYGTGESDCIGAEKRRRRQAQRDELRQLEEERERQEDAERQMRELRLQEEAYSHVKEITTGSISLVGSPTGAKVYIDGNYVGYLPCTILKVNTGYHKLVVKSDGYEDWEVVIDIEPGDTFSTYVELTKLDSK